jgi:hypothetical protein
MKRRLQQVSVTLGKYLPRRCRGNVCIEPLPSNDTGNTHIDTDRRKGFMMYAIEIG